jgi:DDE family transposase
VSELQPQIIEPSRRVERLLDAALRLFDQHVPATPAHGNERLHLRGVIAVLLTGAFHPAMRSLRALDDLSLSPAVQQLTGVGRVARSTLSDALAKFDPDQLRPLIHAIQSQLPQLQRLDPQTALLTRRIIAADGSWFNLAGEVVHAIACRRGNSGKQSRVRLNLQLDVDAWTPADWDVSGKGDGSEANAFIRRLQGGCIYVVDRNFVHFGFINAVLNAGSNLVLRMKKNVGFDVQTNAELTDQDKAHGVLRDQTGVLSGPQSPGNGNARSCTARPPAQTLRQVTVWDAKNQCELVLLTDLLEAPAHVIGVLYRLRWQIELFLRWLKVLACFDHLISQSARGMTTQFYVAVLMTLLIHLQTGLRVSKYALLWVGWVASGQVSTDKMAQAMARHERERELARARRAKKSAV